MSDIRDKLYQKRAGDAGAFRSNSHAHSLASAEPAAYACRPPPRMLDTDGDGAISTAEFEQGIIDILNRPLGPNEAQQIFERLDADGDGVIALDEFTQLLSFVGHTGGRKVGTGGDSGGFTPYGEPTEQNAEAAAAAARANETEAAAAAARTKGLRRPQSAPVRKQADFLSVRRAINQQMMAQKLTVSRQRNLDMMRGGQVM